MTDRECSNPCDEKIYSPGQDGIHWDCSITGAVLGAGLLAYVIIPGLLVIWDRVLDHIDGEKQG